ncbi:DUF262 domain-containing protein [Anaerospora sp.]|uniref:DUF262 domain-containing protein n=1 Tax=Anaerospora sp. TaxID=1960278 RepID=UPI00289D8C2D|nr:DUF262 domain-containing protein [Anaerospora sp.]
MKVTRNVFTIADLIKWFEEKSLLVNKDYQRGGGLWPLNARSYFIDTVLNGYPFPKITLRQTINLRTRKTEREIIDGQQRITTIGDFISNKFELTSVSTEYRGKKFIDLNDEEKEQLLSYEVSVDTIIAASEEEILETFRRMNSYTVPLNDPEKRHATYQGEFKWFIKDMIDLYTPFFEKYKILGVKQISRMLDADLMTELVEVLITGTQSRTTTKLEDLYKQNDKIFPIKPEVSRKLKDTLNYIKVDMNAICSQEILRGYSLYSLFSALVYNKWGIINVNPSDLGGLEPIGEFTTDINKAIQNISELLAAAEQKNEDGDFSEFVKACTSTTHRTNNRMLRLKWLVAALQDKM